MTYMLPEQEESSSPSRQKSVKLISWCRVQGDDTDSYTRLPLLTFADVNPAYSTELGENSQMFFMTQTIGIMSLDRTVSDNIIVRRRDLFEECVRRTLQGLGNAERYQCLALLAEGLNPAYGHVDWSQVSRIAGEDFFGRANHDRGDMADKDGSNVVSAEWVTGWTLATFPDGGSQAR